MTITKPRITIAAVEAFHHALLLRREGTRADYLIAKRALAAELQLDVWQRNPLDDYVGYWDITWNTAQRYLNEWASGSSNDPAD